MMKNTPKYTGKAQMEKQDLKAIDALQTYTCCKESVWVYNYIADKINKTVPQHYSHHFKTVLCIPGLRSLF